MNSPDLPRLRESAASVDATLKDLTGTAAAIATSLQYIDDDRRRMSTMKTVRAVGWPVAPGTIAQGFLGSRWNRRDGNVYASVAVTTRGDDNHQAHQSRAGGRKRTRPRPDH